MYIFTSIMHIVTPGIGGLCGYSLTYLIYKAWIITLIDTPCMGGGCFVNTGGGHGYILSRMQG
jgi:hypothetical protein